MIFRFKVRILWKYVGFQKIKYLNMNVCKRSVVFLLDMIVSLVDSFHQKVFGQFVEFL